MSTRPPTPPTAAPSPPRRHSPAGLYAYAGGYLKAAERLHAAEAAVAIPALSCLAQGLELLAKASLLGSGLPEPHLSRAPYGHDIEACFDAGLERGLRCECSPAERLALARLSDLHAAKELHYLFEFEKSLPDFETVRALAARLQAAVFSQIAGAYWNEAAHHTRATSEARQIVAHLIDDGIAARGHFQVWWALRNRALPDYLEAMNDLEHVDFFHFSNAGHYKNFFVALSRIFDRDPRAAGMRELRKTLSAEGRHDLACYVAENLAGLESQVAKVMQIRNKAIAHNERGMPRDKIYEVNGISPNEIRQVIDVACALINHVADELAISNAIFEGDRLERATLHVLTVLEQGRHARTSAA